jgi:hypothetical protein
LTGLSTIANDWRRFAITWHVLLAALIALFPAGWRPATRAASRMLVRDGNQWNRIVGTGKA